MLDVQVVRAGHGLAGHDLLDAVVTQVELDERLHPGHLGQVHHGDVVVGQVETKYRNNIVLYNYHISHNRAFFLGTFFIK